MNKFASAYWKGLQKIAADPVTAPVNHNIIKQIDGFHDAVGKMPADVRNQLQNYNGPTAMKNLSPAPFVNQAKDNLILGTAGVVGGGIAHLANKALPQPISSVMGALGSAADIAGRMHGAINPPMGLGEASKPLNSTPIPKSIHMMTIPPGMRENAIHQHHREMFGEADQNDRAGYR